MRILLALLAALGIIVSSLALRVHYSTDVQPCDINAHWDCGIVNHSHFAVVHGIPVAIFGIVGYAGLLLFALFGLRRLLLVSAFVGFCYALYLTNLERVQLEVWCLYCVCSQAIISLILLFSAVWTWAGRGRADEAVRA